MKGRVANHWEFNKSDYQKWVAERPKLLGHDVDLSQPSLRSLVALVLSENQDKRFSYTQFQKELSKLPFLQDRHSKKNAPEISIFSLRVAVSDLKKTLERHHSKYQVVTLRRGKEVFFGLEPIGMTQFSGSQALGLPNLIREKTDINDPVCIAQNLVSNGGGLPFASLYATYRSAASWLSTSTHTSMVKNKYEVDSLEKLGLLKYLNETRIGFVGLAPGEGLGEIGMIEHLLEENARAATQRVIDYLPIDSSEPLLMAHVRLLQQRFARAIEAERLCIYPVIGDLYQLKKHLSMLRQRNGETLMKELPVLVTFLGNCIGNYEQHEWDFFRQILEALKEASNVITVVGASLLRYRGAKKPQVVEENYTLDSFLLETPRHLLHDLRLLKSISPSGELVPNEENTEFLLSPEDLQKKVPPEPYSTPFGIRGQVYRFYYILKHLLRAEGGGREIQAGEKILLYSVIKYELPSLLTFLRARGLIIKAPDESRYPILSIVDGNEEFRYAVFAAIRGTSKESY